MVRPKKNSIAAPSNDCPLEECLKFLAGAWTTKILWYLRAEPRRFGDLKRDLAGVSSKVLSTRLRELEERGVLLRKVMPTSPPTVEYSLTLLGHKFAPVLAAIVEVGSELKKTKRPGESEALPAPSRSPAPLSAGAAERVRHSGH